MQLPAVVLQEDNEHATVSRGLMVDDDESCILPISI